MGNYSNITTQISFYVDLRFEFLHLSQTNQTSECVTDPFLWKAGKEISAVCINEWLSFMACINLFSKSQRLIRVLIKSCRCLATPWTRFFCGLHMRGRVPTKSTCLLLVHNRPTANARCRLIRTGESIRLHDAGNGSAGEICNWTRFHGVGLQWIQN